MPSAEAVPAGLRYHQLHRLGAPGWAREVVGVLAVVVLLLLVAPGILIGAYDVAGEPWGDFSIDPLTPAGLVLVCLSLAVAMPLVRGTTRLVHRLDGGWVASVAGRIRWGWLLVCFGLAVVALGASLLLALMVPENGGAAVDSGTHELTDRAVAFLLVIVLLIPLQAAGEEYAFRGYLTQAVGGVLPGRAGAAVAVVVPALLFALAHGVQDPPVFIDRFAFGLVAGVLVIATGGLEAGIAMHVLNNWVFFGLALFFGDIDEALAPVAGTWWLLPGTLVQSLGYLALVTWVARRRGVATATGEAVLEPKQPRV